MSYVGGGVKVEGKGKGKDGRVDKMRLKKLGGIESGGGFCRCLLSSGGLQYRNSNIIALLFGV